MIGQREDGRVNTKLLVLLAVTVAVLISGALVARHYRRKFLTARDLKAGLTAFESGDWPVACRRLGNYLSRRPDDVEVLRKYAQAQLSVQPLKGGNAHAAISAYRRLMLLTPDDAEAYEKLARLYVYSGNHAELAYIAEKRLEKAPDDRMARIWKAKSLIARGRFDEACGEAALKPLLASFAEGQAPDRGTKCTEYVEACRLMALIAQGREKATSNDPDRQWTEALKWAERAVEYDSKSPEAHLLCARLYRVLANEASDESVQEAMAAKARNVLVLVGKLEPSDPRTRLALAREWMSRLHRDFKQAEDVLKSLDGLDPDVVRKHYVDVDDWHAARFLLAAELSFQQNTGGKGAKAADEALARLTRPHHRLGILPRAVRIYVAARRVKDARRTLDEYLGLLSTTGEKPEYGERLAALKALVAAAENKAYRVIELLEPLLATDPQNASLQKILAEAYSRTDQTLRAIQACHACLRTRPDDSDMRHKLVREYIKAGDWTRAHKMAKEADSKSSADMVIRLLRIEMSIYVALERKRTVKEASLQASWNELVELRKTDDRIEIRRLQAYIAFQQGRIDDSIRELELAIKEFEDTLPVELQLARVYLRTKRIGQAIEVCRISIKKHPQKPKAWIALAGLQRINKKPQEAIATLQKALGVVAGPWAKRELTLKLAVFHLLDGDRKTGVALLEALAQEHEREIRARELLLELPEILADAKKGERVIAEIRGIQGQSGLGWRYHQARLLLSREDWRTRQREIAALLTRCLDADPGRPRPALLLSWMYEKLGNPAKAEETCQKSLSANPGAIEVADRLVRLLEGQRRFGDAKDVVDGLEASPRILSIRRLRVAIGSGNFSEAIDELKLRIANDEEERDTEARIMLARLVYWSERDVSLAYKYLDDAVRIDKKASMAVTGVRVSIARTEAERMEEESRRLKQVGKDAEAQKLSKEASRLRTKARSELDRQVTANKSFGAYLMRGRYLVRAKEFDAAEKDFLHLTTLSEKDARGYCFLGVFYTDDLGELDKALDALQKGVEAHPKDLFVKLSLMGTLLQRGQKEDWERAETILAYLEQRLPKDPGLMWSRTRFLLRQNTAAAREKALSLLKEVVKLEPTAVKAHLVLIDLLRRKRKFTEARDRAIRAQGANPSSRALMVARAIVEQELNNQTLAVALADMILAEAPNNADARKILYQAAMRTRDNKTIQRAQIVVSAAIKRNPDDAELLCWSSALYRLAGKLDEAEKRVDKAVQLAPEDPRVFSIVFLERLRWLGQAKRFDDVASLIAEHKAKNPKDAVSIELAASMLAFSKLEKHRRTAMGLYAEAIALVPKSILPRTHYAWFAYEIGQTNLAEKQWREVLALKPDNVVALNALAWILQKSGKYEEALELADRGVKLAPDNPYLLDTRGVILMNLPGRLADAKKDFEKLLTLARPDTAARAKALLQLGRVCAKLKNPAQAKQHFTEAAKIDRKLDVFSAEERLEIKKAVGSDSLSLGS